MRALVIYATICMAGCMSQKSWQYALLHEDTRVPRNHTYDQGLLDHIARLDRGPSVEARDCARYSLIFPLQLAFYASEDRAIAKAVDQLPAGYDAIADASTTWAHKSLGPFYTSSCFAVHGTAAKNRRYSASR